MNIKVKISFSKKEFETILPKNFDELKNLCMKEFGLTSDDLNKSYDITYIDEEGEFIIIENEDDFFQAIKYYNSYPSLKLQFKIVERIDGNQTVTSFEDQIKSEPIFYKREIMINYDELKKKEKEIQEKINYLEEEKKNLNEQNKTFEEEKKKFEEEKIQFNKNIEEEKIKYNKNIEECKNKYNKDIENYINKLKEESKKNESLEEKILKLENEKSIKFQEYELEITKYQNEKKQIEMEKMKIKEEKDNLDKELEKKNIEEEESIKIFENQKLEFENQKIEFENQKIEYEKKKNFEKNNEEIIKRKEEELKKKEEQIKQKQNQLNKKEEEINKKYEEFNRKEEQQLEKEEERKRKDEEQIEKEKELNKKEKEMNKKEKDLNKKEEQLNKKEEQLNKIQEQLNKKQEPLNKKQEQLNKKQEQLNKKQEEFNRQKEEEKKKKEEDKKKKEEDKKKKEEDKKKKEKEKKNKEKEKKKEEEKTIEELNQSNNSKNLLFPDNEFNTQLNIIKSELSLELKQIIEKEVKTLEDKLISNTIIKNNQLISSYIEKINKIEEIKQNYFLSKIVQSKISMSACDTKHYGIKCEKCKINPIKGIRFKCNICDNYNLCEKCEDDNQNEQFHDLSHEFIRIRKQSNQNLYDKNKYKFILQNQNIEWNFDLNKVLDNQTIELSLIFQNNGKIKWPKETKIKCIKDKSQLLCEDMEIPQLNENEQKTIICKINIQNKIKEKTYKLVLGFFVNNLQYGQTMEIKIKIFDKLKCIINELKEMNLYKEEKLEEIKLMVKNDRILEDIIDILINDNQNK